MRIHVLTMLLAFTLGPNVLSHAQSENSGGMVLSGSAPVIACDEPVWNFGERPADATVVHVFEIWNRGDAPLEISRVRACCGTSAMLADQVVAPGTSTTVRVTSSLRGRRGRQLRTVYVHSNDPRQPLFQLRVTGSVAVPDHRPPVASSPQTVVTANQTVNESAATVLPPEAAVPDDAIRAVPAELQLAQEKDAAVPFHTLLVRSADRTSFQVTRVDCPSDDWQVDLRLLAPGLWRVRISHIVDGAAFDGQAILIHTDVPDFPVVTVPIRRKEE